MRQRPVPLQAAAVSCGLLLLFGVSASGQMGDSGERPRRARYVPLELIVRHVDGAAEEDVEWARNSVGATHVEPVARGNSVRVDLVQLAPGTDLEEAMAQLNQDPSVLYAEPNYIQEPQAVLVPNDPFFPSQWGMHNTGQLGGRPDVDIDAVEAAAKQTGSSSVYVGVIDTGLDFNHPDLAGVLINPGEDVNRDGLITSADVNGRDDDGNGKVDDLRGWDFANNDNSIYDPTGSSDTFTDMHGTHVAGIIGAVGNNAKGVAGVNWNVRLIAAKFLGTSGGTTAHAVKAIDYFTDLKSRGVNLVATNNSWGSEDYSLALQDAIERARVAGILFVAAAGNGGMDALGDNNDKKPFYPASYPHANIISVTAIDQMDKLAAFANYGPTSVDVGAPGVSIYSTAPKGSYMWLTGTSMATPHVTGICALIKAQKPALTSAKIRNRVRRRVVVTSALSGKVASNGRVNAYRSLVNSSEIDP